jgi:hypothetical protein
VTNLWFTLLVGSVAELGFAPKWSELRAWLSTWPRWHSRETFSAWIPWPIWTQKPQINMCSWFPRFFVCVWGGPRDIFLRFK